MNIDFENTHIQIKDSKGAKDRIVPLPKRIIDTLRVHLAKVKKMHNGDLSQGHGKVYLPYALDKKYPHANREWIWQYVFPSAKLSVDPRSGVVRRHHILDQTVQRIMRMAVKYKNVQLCIPCDTALPRIF